MTIINQKLKRKNVRQEVREFQQAANKIGRSKESARRFLISTGIYTTAGKLKPAYR